MSYFTSAPNKLHLAIFYVCAPNSNTRLILSLGAQYLKVSGCYTLSHKSTSTLKGVSPVSGLFHTKINAQTRKTDIRPHYKNLVIRNYNFAKSDQPDENGLVAPTRIFSKNYTANKS